MTFTDGLSHVRPGVDALCAKEASRVDASADSAVPTSAGSKAAVHRHSQPGAPFAAEPAGVAEAPDPEGLTLLVTPGSLAEQTGHARVVTGRVLESRVVRTGEGASVIGPGVLAAGSVGRSPSESTNGVVQWSW